MHPITLDHVAQSHLLSIRRFFKPPFLFFHDFFIVYFSFYHLFQCRAHCRLSLVTNCLHFKLFANFLNSSTKWVVLNSVIIILPLPPASLKIFIFSIIFLKSVFLLYKWCVSSNPSTAKLSWWADIFLIVLLNLSKTFHFSYYHLYE